MIHTNDKRITPFFAQLWQQYIDLCPQILTIDKLFFKNGEKKIVNDHVAFRTLACNSVGLAQLIPLLESLNYHVKEYYDFKEKHLNAVHLEHPDSQAPKIFISELRVIELPKDLQKPLLSVLDCLPTQLNQSYDIFYSGRNWPIDWHLHTKLASVSEYAAWFYIFGYCANHFTISVNHLETFDNIEAVNQFLKDNKIALNTTNGEIKGSEKTFLKQSATLAFETKVDDHIIPSVFREFAQRFTQPDGRTYQGFVENNANAIFDSTNLKRSPS